MKKIKLYAGITLIVQSIFMAVVFIMLYSKKKSLAKTFAALAAAGGVAGAYLLISEAKDNCRRARMMAMDACCDMTDEDFAEDEIADEDISCCYEDEHCCCDANEDEQA